MGTINLSSILITPLRRIEINGGDVLHAMKRGDAGYVGFGEVYISEIFSGAVKAWKRHTRMTMNIVVPVGRVKFVFRGQDVDGNDDFRVEEIGEDNYARITVPPGIWFGFQGRRQPHSLVLNVANIPHDLTEVERLPLSGISYEWS